MKTKITIDRAGRFVIPKPVRDKLHLTPGDMLEVDSDGEHIVLRPVLAKGDMRKEKGMWVFYSGTGRTITQDETNELIREDREERHRRFLGEK